jgi:hypothetical protein
MEVESAKFTNYFLGFPGSNQDSKTSSPLYREGVVELCHNWGTESDPDFSGYHNGNKSPQGFGHIAITCNDVEKTCAYLEEKQVKVCDSSFLCTFSLNGTRSSFSPKGLVTQVTCRAEMLCFCAIVPKEIEGWFHERNR